MHIDIALNDQIDTDEVLEIYTANQWSSADKPEALMSALRNSHGLVTARSAGKLLGLGNAISDGFLVVYCKRSAVPPNLSLIYSESLSSTQCR